MSEQKAAACDNAAVETDITSEAVSVRRILSGRTERVVFWAAVACSLFHLWVNTVGIMPEIQRNAVHYGFMLFMGFLCYPLLPRRACDVLKLDYVLAFLAVAAALYLEIGRASCRERV